MKNWIAFGLVVLMIVLHQDFWFWLDSRLVFGFLPVGLFYHVCYSILAACVLALLIKLVWPHELDEHEETPAKQPGVEPRS